MRVDLYALITDKIEEGLAHGLRRVYKHDSRPRTEDELLAATDTIMQEIAAALCEYLKFSDDGDEI